MKTHLFGAILALSVGCAEKKPEAAAPKAPAAAQSARAASPAEKKGLEAAGNDPEVVALAKAALECPPDRGDPFDNDCAAYKVFRASQLPGKAHATLLNFIEDADERVRFLGALSLPDGFAMSPRPAHVVERGPALRVVRALEAERNERLAHLLGALVGHIDVEKTGLLEQIAALVSTHPHRYVAREVLGPLLMVNSGSRSTFDYMMTMTRHAEPGVRDAAVRAFWTGGLSWKPETCKIWEERLADPDPGIAGQSAQSLGWYSGHCAESWDALLQSVEARLQAGNQSGNTSFVHGLTKMCEQPLVTPEQQKKATVMARKFAADKGAFSSVRMEGLSAVHACDHTGGSAFVAKFTRDKEKWVAGRAKELLKEKRKK
jgi:hypothetical protein